MDRRVCLLRIKTVAISTAEIYWPEMEVDEVKVHGKEGNL